MHISRHLEQLYGASLYMDIMKMGEMQIFVVSLDVVNPCFVKEDSGLFYSGIELLNDILMHPVLEEGVFPEEHFHQERVNLERYVRSAIDDKIAYTHMRLIQEMFRDEPFGRYEWGDLKKIPHMDPRKVYLCYKNLLKAAPIDVYVVGRLSEEEEKKLPFLILPIDREHTDAFPPGEDRPFDGREELIVEEQPLEQSKLELGFKVDVHCEEEDYYAIALYNSILGGGSFSKLFKGVREEANLAYYIHSTYDKIKGVLYVAAGIDYDKSEKVKDMVRICMEEIQEGKISNEEFTNAKKSLITGLRSVADNPSQTIDFNLSCRTTNRSTEVQHIVDIIEGLEKERVSKVSRFIFPGKTFILKGTGNNHGADED
jgi:predicted Zn-dependent peptidase